MPLLISIITSILDATRDKITAHYPNMGELKCFLGETRGQVNSYFGTAQFLYFDMFTILILVSNLYFLGCVWRIIHKGWQMNQASLRGMTG